ncbi:MAG: deoxyribonuclease V [Chloroflexi bacterium]|nr:deoxyribonuclease V [Chloroflexota bacterium]
MTLHSEGHLDPFEHWDHEMALRVQLGVAARVERTTRLGAVQLVAGADCSQVRTRFEVLAAIVVLTYPELTVVQRAVAYHQTDVPYVPGFLSFREVPALLAAWNTLRVVPELIFVDGQGAAHPRRCGVASHLGVILDIPSVGVAKSVLVGRPAGILGEAVGSTVPLVDRDEVIGELVRTRAGSQPVIVSTGNRVSLEDAVSWVQWCSRGYRLPLPVHLAHRLLSDARKPSGS